MMREGVVDLKSPSLSFLSHRSSSSRRRVSNSSSSAPCSSLTVSSASSTALASVSLGHLTLSDFPILHQEVNGSKLVYLDNAATSQKPSSVLKAFQDYYGSYNSNVHRGIHYLRYLVNADFGFRGCCRNGGSLGGFTVLLLCSTKSTDEYELARKVAAFINAPDSGEIVFTRNATEAINLVAYSWGLSNLKPGDEVLSTIVEHHSAIVPWQIVAQKTGALLKFVDLNEQEVPDLQKLKECFQGRQNL